MVIVKDVKEPNLVCVDCYNHTGCNNDVTPEGGGLQCGGSVTD